jgi:hypothetical protein
MGKRLRCEPRLERWGATLHRQSMQIFKRIAIDDPHAARTHEGDESAAP